MQTDTQKEGQIDPLFRDILATHKVPSFVATGTFVELSDEEIEALRLQKPLEPENRGPMLSTTEEEEE